jgi:hypothetical protein
MAGIMRMVETNPIMASAVVLLMLSSSAVLPGLAEPASLQKTSDRNGQEARSLDQASLLDIFIRICWAVNVTGAPEGEPSIPTIAPEAI